MKVRIVIYLFLLWAPAFISQAQNKTTAQDPYAEVVMKERMKKDEECRDPKVSPFDPEDQKTFTGLKYYPYNPAFRVKAKVEKIANPVVFKMKTTTERRPEYRTYAKVSFTIQGKDCSLFVYQPVSRMGQPGFEQYLFLPFTDESSGRETYGGGRFLDLQIPSGNEMVIDFNACYNPYCAYSHRYSCPVPPEENDLPVSISAGEKPYHK